MTLLDIPKIIKTTGRETAEQQKPETPHQRVFRLVREKKYEEASRLAKMLIDAGKARGFFRCSGVEYEAEKKKYLVKVAEGAAKARRGDVAAAVETITPEYAQVLLEHNEKNRNIKLSGLVDRLRDLSEGRWEMTGQPIIVSSDGATNDGQHRLYGILLSGVSVPLLVVYGPARSSILKTDIGERRQPSDRFKLAGITNESRAAAIVRVVASIDFGRRPTDTELTDRYEDDPDAYQFAVVVTHGLPKGACYSGLGAGAFYLLKRGANRQLIEKFFREVRSPDRVALRSPTQILREDILLKKTRAPAEHWATTTVALFRLWVSNKRIKNIDITTTFEGK